MVEGRNLTRPVDDAFWTVVGIDCYGVAYWDNNRKLDAQPSARLVAGIHFAHSQHSHLVRSRLSRCDRIASDTLIVPTRANLSK